MCRWSDLAHRHTPLGLETIEHCKTPLHNGGILAYMVANDGKFFALSNSRAHTLVLSDEELLKRRGLFHWSTIISAMWDGYAPWAEAKDHTWPRRSGTVTSNRSLNIIQKFP